MNGLESEKDSHKGRILVVTEIPDIVYILDGIPIPLQRHRHGNGNTWDGQRAKKVMTNISLQSQHKNRPLYQGPLHLDIRFYFPIPQRGARSKVIWDNKPHFIKPDISNCIKYIEDVCTKLLFDDDCLIATLYSEKKYDRRPRTEFYIIELEHS